MDPEHSTGFKFLQMVLTALVSVPTLLTVFTITARFAHQVSGLGDRDQPGDLETVRLATEGDSARQIPACNSCHVQGSGGPIETPVLTGQDRAYLVAQLVAYKTGARQNDVYRRMRDIAGKLSDRRSNCSRATIRAVSDDAAATKVEFLRAAEASC